MHNNYCCCKKLNFHVLPLKKKQKQTTNKKQKNQKQKQNQKQANKQKQQTTKRKTFTCLKHSYSFPSSKKIKQLSCFQKCWYNRHVFACLLLFFLCFCEGEGKNFQGCPINFWNCTGTLWSKLIPLTLNLSTIFLSKLSVLFLSEYSSVFDPSSPYMRMNTLASVPAPETSPVVMVISYGIPRKEI